MEGKMSRLKEKLRERSPLARWIIWSTVAFLLLICLSRTGNIFRWAQAGFTLRRQHRQIELYQDEIRALDEKVRSLSTNRDTLEQFAREQFHFAEPGEDVYIVEE